MIFSFIDDDEWDEDRYDAVNYGDIPDTLWALIPSSQKYIENIMKFCSYVNRESILRLKCDKEVKAMFKYVTDRIQLVQDRRAMFGIFEPDPTSLDAMPPGFKPTFKRFLARVENLVPLRNRPSSKRPASGEPTSSKSSSKSLKRSATSLPTDQGEDKTVSVTDMETRILKWIASQKTTLEKKVSKEDQERSFELKAADVHNEFKFRCLQNNCFEKFTLKFVKRSNTVNASSVYRHITNTCWLSAKVTPSFQKTDSKTSKIFTVFKATS